MFDQIVRGTRRTIEFARHCQAERLLLTSSGAVYGRQSPGVLLLPEESSGGPDPLDSKSAYSEAKRAAEFLVAAGSRAWGFETKIARCFAFVGPFLPLDAHFAVGNFIRDGLNGVPIRVGGDGTPYRSYLYASELVHWLLTILLDAPSCRPYNVGSETALSIREVAEGVSRMFPQLGGIQVAGIPDLGKAPERYVPSVGRAGNELGLVQRIPFSEAVARTVRFHLKERGNDSGS
jgi:dTDP-glucose 4,6-dehydratase